MCPCLMQSYKVFHYFHSIWCTERASAEQWLCLHTLNDCLSSRQFISHNYIYAFSESRPSVLRYTCSVYFLHGTCICVCFISTLRRCILIKSTQHEWWALFAPWKVAPRAQETLWNTQCLRFVFAIFCFTALFLPRYQISALVCNLNFKHP